MSAFTQNIAVLLIVGGCATYVGWQLLQAFRGRKSKLGSCCAKGCEVSKRKESGGQANPAVQFLPLGNVGIRVKK